MTPAPKPNFKKRNKFGATKSYRGDHAFPSKLEAAVFDLLTLRERAGEIKEIQRQPSVKLTLALIGYKPDFKFFDIKLNEYVWVEAKGAETEGYRIRKRLWACYGPGRLLVYKGHHKALKLAEEIVPKNSLLAELERKSS